MTPAEFLRRARARIEKPENWTQGSFGKNRLGESCGPHDYAVCWCADGSMLTELEGFSGVPYATYQTAADELSIAMSGELISAYNDTHTHAEVLAAFDQAIAALDNHST